MDDGQKMLAGSVGTLEDKLLSGLPTVWAIDAPSTQSGLSCLTVESFAARFSVKVGTEEMTMEEAQIHIVKPMPAPREP